MQILLALIFGAAVGLVANFVVAGRETRGGALAPVLGAVVGGLVWMIGTWAGWGIDNPLLWIAALVAPVVVVAPTLVVVRRARISRDAAERERLRIA